jgi:hypothetical protein
MAEFFRQSILRKDGKTLYKRALMILVLSLACTESREQKTRLLVAKGDSLSKLN